MDYDKDGRLDFVSGSYDLGEVFWFRNLGKASGGNARFEAAVMLLDVAGMPLVHHPDQWREYARLRKEVGEADPATTTAKVANYGSFPMPVDFDGDGDLDMLIGSLGGGVYLRETVPHRAKGKRTPVPGFAPTAVPLLADGVPLQVYSHADPFAADWDGDGLWDLVVGAGDGSVGWYRNLGTLEAPQFGARQELVAPKSTTDQVKRSFDEQGRPQPGTRAQICVADYDGDGRVDLLVGDYGTGEAGKQARTSYVWLYLRSGPITPGR